MIQNLMPAAPFYISQSPNPLLIFCRSSNSPMQPFQERSVATVSATSATASATATATTFLAAIPSAPVATASSILASLISWKGRRLPPPSLLPHYFKMSLFHLFSSIQSALDIWPMYYLGISLCKAYIALQNLLNHGLLQHQPSPKCTLDLGQNNMVSPHDSKQLSVSDCLKNVP